MQLPSLEAGERSASFSYSVDESKSNLSSNGVESYVINAQDGNGSSDSGDFNLSIVAAGVDNKLTVDSYQSGNIDDVSFANLSAINLQGGNDTAVITANGQIDSIDGGDGSNTLNILAPLANVDIKAPGNGAIEGNASFNNFSTVNASMVAP